MCTVFSILYTMTFLPGVRLWYSVRHEPEKFIEGEDERESLDFGPISFDSEEDDDEEESFGGFSFGDDSDVTSFISTEAARFIDF